MQCRDRHKSFVFNIRDVCFIMKMKNVKKIDMNKKLYEQIKALLADKLDEKEQKELFHHREFEEKMHLQWNMDRQKELDDVKKQFDIYKAKMESLLISQLELLKDVNKDD